MHTPARPPRFPEAICDQKYPCYDHLISVMKVPPRADTNAADGGGAGDVTNGSGVGGGTGTSQPSGGPGYSTVTIDPLTANLLTAGTQLVFYTCSVSPLNVREFVKAGGVTKLYEIISYAMYVFTHSSSRDKDPQDTTPPPSHSHTHYPPATTGARAGYGISSPGFSAAQSSPSRETAKELLIYGMKAFTAVSNFEVRLITTPT